MSYVPLTAPDVSFDADGHFRNRSYDDVYHSTRGALGQAEHVFVRGNGLPERWRGRRAFTVCETGFGVGLNFLALWNAWRADGARSTRLHMLSIEAHPFARDDLAQALQRVIPEPLQKLADQLVAQWPPSLPGLHRLEFEGGAVTLTLAFGQAALVAPRLRAVVDAYFFDGFAPARNPDAWEPKLLRTLGKLAAPDATLATWASSGAVRAAFKEAGFDVRRQPGYADKWHMTVGLRSQATPYVGTRSAKFIRKGSLNDAAWTQARDVDRAGNGEVIVIGAGLAGAGIAQALAIRGRSVVVIDTAISRADMTHAGHVAAALTPVIARDDNSRARLARAGSARALARWMSLPASVAPVRCGTVQLERDEGRMASLEETLQQLQFPESWVRSVDRDEASHLAGVSVTRGGVFFSDGLLVKPDALIASLLTSPGVRYVAGHVSTLIRAGDSWQAQDADGQMLAQAATVVVANAIGAKTLLEQSGLLDPLPRLSKMVRLAGQVCLLPEQELAAVPRCIVSGEGYFLPAVQGNCVVGSTYELDAQLAQVSAVGQREILEKMAGLLDVGLPEQSPSSSLSGWAGWRAVLPGQVPAVGPLPHAPGVWVAAGYASRGLSWSALSGDIIASALCGEPLPLETDLLAAIAPK